jgi:ADP-heptose:LPS heptosyltransferase
MLKQLIRSILPNPLHRLLKTVKKSECPKILIVWNRGLGDIPLGLYALVQRIRHFLPNASITFLTREDLKEGFALLEGVQTNISPSMERGDPFHLLQTLYEQNLKEKDFDLIIEKPDPTRWLGWQLGKLIPRLKWNHTWDALWRSFPIDEHCDYIGIHVQTETNYSYEKNWPLQSWKELFERVFQEKGIKCILFGFRSEPAFSSEAIIDLRGKTSLFEMLSIIKNRCKYLVVPDSGVLSITYYLDTAFPIKIVSLWADPHQGILRQKVSSPNPLLIHRPLLGKKENISTISVDDVIQSLFVKDIS